MFSTNEVQRAHEHAAGASSNFCELRSIYGFCFNIFLNVSDTFYLDEWRELYRKVILPQTAASPYCSFWLNVTFFIIHERCVWQITLQQVIYLV